VSLRSRGGFGARCGQRRGQSRTALALARGRRSRTASRSRSAYPGWPRPTRPYNSWRMANSTLRGLHTGPSAGPRRGAACASAPWASISCSASSEPSASRWASRTVRLTSFTLASVRL